MIIFRQEGTTCVVVCPVEADNRYFPCNSYRQEGVEGEMYTFTDSTPVFDTQGEAWAHHIKVIEELKGQQHEQIDKRWETSLHQIRKRTGRSLALVQSDE